MGDQIPRYGNLFGSAMFFFLAPGTVAGFAPWVISDWRLPAGGFGVLQWTGAALIAVSAIALIECFIRFVRDGEGTPAPVAKTKKLVVKGLYRHTRNPMYVAVAGLIFGQAILFQNTQVAWYGAAVWFAFHIFVVFFEERRLRREFGSEYEAYRKNVPRWLPRLTPWRPEKNEGAAR